jgi:hypothetical protein
MKYDLRTKILSYDGKPLKESGEELTLSTVCLVALNNFSRDETPTAEVKSKCFQISCKISNTKEPDLTIPEVSLILERVDKVYSSPIVCGRVKEFFEKDKEDKGE